MLSASRPFKEISFAQDLVFVGAQYAPAASGATLREQAAAIFGRLRSILQSAGLTLNDVVKIGVFYHQSLMEEEDALLKEIRMLFTSEAPLPVVTAIPLHHLPHGSLVQIELIGLLPDSQRSRMRRVVSYDPVHGFSSAIRCDDIVFVGAKMSVDGQGQVIQVDDMVGQARATMDNIKASMQDVGVGLQSVVKLNTYYVGHGTTSDWSMAARVRSDAFDKPGPGATGVPVPGPYPRGLLLRQEAIAIANDDGSPKHRDTSWPDGVWDWPIPVSFQQGIKLDDLIVLGGQVSASVKGEAVHPGDLAAQTRRVMETIETILGGFGRTDCNCLAKLTILYATNGDPTDERTILDIVRPFFPEAMPTLTLIPLARLGFEGIEIEIEGIGVVKSAD
ncbi:enamine deaminase RidA (YjgF/YER057c/UK114 family) [Rhodoligotrophos appendicifer]|uniref:RidA family protein n=1 Tax=Rhodoligotrophos appendicifer TaxID=987056 RepID=UPI0011871055|nr:Rid family hydrolase [Rhodoligotrophos appendicifer]